MKIITDINKEIKRIRNSSEPHAAVQIEAGKAQYVTQTPKDDGSFDCVEISDWMPIDEMPAYMAKHG